MFANRAAAEPQTARPATRRAIGSQQLPPDCEWTVSVALHSLAWTAWNQRLYREHGFGLLLLTLREGGEFVGDCGLTPQQVDGVIEVGYHVRAVLQGRGLATEAAAACRDYARDVLGVDRLIAIIDPRNRPSQRVAEKLGLVVERDSDSHGRWRTPHRIYVASLGQRRVLGVKGVGLGEPASGSRSTPGGPADAR